VNCQVRFYSRRSVVAAASAASCVPTNAMMSEIDLSRLQPPPVAALLLFLYERALPNRCDSLNHTLR
jgi:hypothetical protein